MAPSRSLSDVFAPRRVAVVGASDKPGSPGQVLWRNLREFPGEVVPVTRNGQSFDGHRAYPTLNAIPGRVDLAVIAVPAAATLAVVQDAVSAGVGACIVVSAGFAETGAEGAALQDELVRTARAGGVLLVGPNCLGVQNCDLGMNASLAAGGGTGGGGIAVITQSGSYAMALHALSADEGVAFSTAYSSGNHGDIDDSEVIEHLRTDDGTDVICAFLESLGDGSRFLDAAAATAPIKPIVLTAVGRSVAGARAAASHTAALASDRRAWPDVLSGTGVTMTRSGLEMLDAARVLHARPLPPGSRVGIVTNSGGTGTELADLLADEGLSVPLLSASLRRDLATILPAYASTANPVDITPIWPRFTELYPFVIDTLARSGEVDSVIVVLLHRSAEDPEVARAVVAAVERLRADRVDVAVQVCWVARRSAWPVAGILQAAGIACLEWPARTARALGHAVRYAAFRRLAEPAVPVVPVVARSLPAGLSGSPPALRALLAGFGIAMAESALTGSAVGAVAAARRIGYPVVLKVDHPSLSHKSDVGGVRVGLVDDTTVRAAATELSALAPGAQVLVQPMHRGVELVIGGLRDEVLGPIVAFGLGGVFVEILDDVGFSRAPLSHAAARRLVDSPRGSAVLDGVRGGDPVDREAVADLIEAVGRVLVTFDEIAELDLNPVLAGPDGCVAVDVRLILRQQAG